MFGHVARGKPSGGAGDPIDWRRLICRTASALGMMPGAVRDGMTLDDVLDLHDYWRDHPPVQWMVQSYLGIKTDKPARGARSEKVEQMPGVQVGATLPAFYRGI